jgi:WD40 repeat protein
VSALFRTLSTGGEQLTFSPSGDFLASATGYDTVQVWEVATGKESQTLRLGHAPIAFSPNWRWVAAANDRLMTLWEVVGGQRGVTVRGHREWLTSATFSPDGRLLVTGSADHTAKVWDATDGREIGQISHGAGVMAVAFRPNTRVVATGSWDGTVALSQISPTSRIGEWVVKTIRTVRPEEQVFRIAFSPDGNVLATGDVDGSVKLWHVDSGSLIKALREPDREPGQTTSSIVAGLSFSPDGRLLAAAHTGGRVRLWLVSSGELAKELLSAGTQVAFSPDGRLLATAADDLSIKLWGVRQSRAD